MGNPVGSTNADFCNLPLDTETAYMVGLWCADGYHRTSSIGLSNTDRDLIKRFGDFLRKLFPEERLKMRIYEPYVGKRTSRAYHVYVNCRPLLRWFRKWKSGELRIGLELALPYLAGRFDGDGSVGKDFYRDCRIIYGDSKDAEKDFNLVKSLGFARAKLYNYRAAKTFCLYFSRMETVKFLSGIYPYSTRLQKSVFVPRRDLPGPTFVKVELDR